MKIMGAQMANKIFPYQLLHDRLGIASTLLLPFG